MEFNRAQLIDAYFGKIQNKEIDFSNMRPSLKEIGLPDDEIGIIVKQVDKQLQQAAINKASHSTGRNLFYGGVAFAAIGLVITIGTMFSLIDSGSVYIIAYGPVISGSAIAAAGYSKMNRGR